MLLGRCSCIYEREVGLLARRTSTTDELRRVRHPTSISIMSYWQTVCEAGSDRANRYVLRSVDPFAMSALDLDEEALAPWNFTWIVKRELAIMGYPKCKGNVKYLMQNNIGHLISLSPEKQPPFELFPNNFKWTPLDILEFEPPTPEQIQTFIRISRETLASHQVPFNDTVLK